MFKLREVSRHKTVQVLADDVRDARLFGGAGFLERQTSQVFALRVVALTTGALPFEDPAPFRLNRFSGVSPIRIESGV